MSLIVQKFDALRHGWSALEVDTRRAYGVIGLGLIFRILLSIIMPLGVDEAYAVVVSRSHALSYFDHPPLGFALGRFMADITQSETAFIVRFPYVVLGTITAFLLYDLTRTTYGQRAGLWAVCAYCVAPFFVVSGGMFVVPDAPLFASLMGALWLVAPVLTKDAPSQSAWRWMGAGACLALALLSKYQAGLFGISALMALGLNPNWRRHFSNPFLWVGLLIASLGLMPSLVWNMRHEWASLSYQGARAAHDASLLAHLGNFIAVMLGQALYLMPLTFVMAYRLVFNALRRPEPAMDWLLGLMAVVPIVIFAIIALFGENSLPHWAMSGFIFALPLVGKAIADQTDAKRKQTKRFFVWSAGILVILFGLMMLQARTAFLTRPFYKQAPSFDLDWQNLDWSALSQTDADKAEFIVTSSWVSGGRAGHALGPKSPIIVLKEPHHFAYMPIPTDARDGYFIVALRYGKPYEKDKAKALALMQGQFTIMGQPIIEPQTRMGFKSFDLMLVPVTPIKKSGDPKP